MDGIDAALARLADGAVELIAGHTTPYPHDLHERLVYAIDNPRDLGVDRLGDLDARLGEAFAAATLALLADAGVGPGEVRAIGSHGQTVRHRADQKPPFTLQLADPNIIVARTGITTVADFRRRDLALGGEGAPLAPAFHGAMFGIPGETRTVVNLGGIANITVLGADGAIIGFDTGPANGLMDAWISQHRGEPYDDRGRWAASGKVDNDLLSRLSADPFFARVPPKSTGREYFNLPWLTAHLMAIPRAPAPEDVQATLSELTAATVADAIKPQAPDATLCLACGGGAYNTDLMKRLARRLDGVRVTTTDAVGPAPEWVESAGFAWLASRTLAGLPGNVPAVTGASRETVLGAIFPA